MATDPVPPTPPSFFLDRPKHNLKDDALGRKGFVRSFWKALRSHEASESFVIGVQAPWGDGKTTFKEMVIQLEADEGKNEKLVFVRFNPWEWAGQNQVADAFYKELGSQLSIQTKSTHGAMRAKWLQVNLLRLGGGLGMLTSLSHSVAIATGVTNPDYAGAAAAASAAFGAAQMAFKHLAESQQATTPAEPVSVETIKQELREGFEGYRQDTGFNIVVVIDDIDRLSPDEIRHVLQLVKINADFPGLIFVLLYDRSYVERSLKRQFGSDGRQFLEKIVQFELTLPPAPEGALLRALTDGMKQSLSTRPLYIPLLDVQRIKAVFDVWLHLHLTNPRKHGRLVSTWAFHLGVFDSSVPEINPVDLLILDALSLFEPKIYQQLSRSYADLFPSGYETIAHYGRLEPGPSRRLQALDRIGGLADLNHRPSVIGALKVLMGVVHGDFAEVDQQEADTRSRELRFCHPDYFRRYFRLNIDSGDVSNQTIQDLDGLRDTPHEFFGRLDELEQDGLVLDALDRWAALPKRAFSQAGIFLVCLLDWWERRLVSRTTSSERIGLAAEFDNRMLRLAVSVLAERENGERLAALLASLGDSRAVFAATRLAFYEALRSHDKEVNGRSDGAGLLDSAGVVELNQAAATGLIERFKRVPPKATIYENEAVFWVWGHAGNLRTLIAAELTKTPGGTATLLQATIGRYVHEPMTSKDPELLRSALLKFISLEALADAVRTFQPQIENFSKGAQQAAQRLFQIVESPLSSVSSETEESPAHPEDRSGPAELPAIPHSPPPAAPPPTCPGG